MANSSPSINHMATHNSNNGKSHGDVIRGKKKKSNSFSRNLRRINLKVTK